MSEKKIPDSYVMNRPLRAWPTEIGSPNFAADNIALFKSEKTHRLKNIYSSKFDQLQKEYQKLIAEIALNERLYKAKHNFEPIPGKTYYLYSHTEGEFLSIISPREWGNKFQFFGAFVYLSDGRWEESDLSIN